MKKTAFFFCFCIIFFNLFLIFFQINSSQAEINPIIINQVMIGQDDNVLNEFIELYNPNDVAIDLKNYSLKKKTISDNESSLISSKKFNGIIPAKSYFLISSPVFGPSIKSDLNYSNSNSLSPNNTLILYDTDKNISDQILLNDLVLLKNNQSLKRASLDSQIDTNFVIESDNITIINSKNEIITISNYQEVATSTDTTINQSSSTDYQITNLKNIKNLPNKSLVIVEGLVSVLPGVLGTQYFYIHDKYDDDYNVYGLKIYNYNKLFPELKIGDQIQVQGEVAISSNNELSFKIKTKDISDIKIISNNNPLPTSTIENINSFTKTQADNLKTIQGQITQNSNGEIYLNDNQNEILIKIKTGTKISSKKLVVGQNFLISGLLAFASSSSLPQIIPINLESIKNLDIIEENIEIADSQTLNNEFWETNTQKRNKIILIYLIIFIIFTAIFIFFKKK
ncbi:MAG TPA: lamin tail domain-containing protein [bacterium]|nr:lamin tail domain-containing protein [bacterium]